MFCQKILNSIPAQRAAPSVTKKGIGGVTFITCNQSRKAPMASLRKGMHVAFVYRKLSTNKYAKVVVMQR